MKRTLAFATLFAMLAAIVPSAPVTAAPAASQYAGLKWRFVGPLRGGRTKAIAGVPDKPNRFYIASVNGGIWRTDNAGRTWTPIFDGESSGSIGSLAIAPSDTNT